MKQGHRSMPVLAVTDVDKTAEFFVSGLGFSLAGKWTEDDGVPTFAIVRMDDITVGMQVVEKAVPTGPWATYLYIEDVDAFADQIQGNGVALEREPMDRFYGCRDLEVKDPDGNLLCFGQDLSPCEAGPGL